MNDWQLSTDLAGRRTDPSGPRSLSRDRVAQFLILCAVAGCERGGHVDTLCRPDRDRDPSCVRAHGCPAPAAIAPCVDGVMPMSLASLEQALRAGGRVAVRGPLERSLADRSCTLLGCFGACCNECTTPFALGATTGLSATQYERIRETTLQLHGPGLGCSGDESLECCTLDAHGQDVVAQGVIQRHGITYILEQATVCAPAP